MGSWNETRLKLERSTHNGCFLRRRQASESAARGAVFYIHGLGESGLCFEKVISDPRLAAWHHVVPDMLGYGKSTWSDEPLDVEAHARHLAHVIEGLELHKLGPLTVAGHSMGGVIGLYLARELQNSGLPLAGLFNIEGNISPSDCTGSAIAAGHSLDDWLDHGFEEYLAGLHAPVDEGDISQERAWVLRSYAASATHCDPRTLHLNSCDLVRESGTETLASHLADLGLDQLYVHGFPRGTGPRSLELLKKAEIPTFSVNDAGHWPYLDQHDAFVDCLVDFLNR